MKLVTTQLLRNLTGNCDFASFAHFLTHFSNVNFRAQLNYEKIAGARNVQGNLHTGRIKSKFRKLLKRLDNVIQVFEGKVA